ncbi:unnamed protein product [Sphagnum balticum]
MQTSLDTVVVFCAQSGPLISRRLDQLPVVPTIGVIFNFDSEYYRQVEHPIVCLGRTAGGKSRNLDVMLFEGLSMIHSEVEVVEILRRRIISYTVPDSGGSSIIKITDSIEPGCSELMIVQCKRLPKPENSNSLSLSQMLAFATAEDKPDDKSDETDALNTN